MELASLPFAASPNHLCYNFYCRVSLHFEIVSGACWTLEIVDSETVNYIVNFVVHT